MAIGAPSDGILLGAFGEAPNAAREGACAPQTKRGDSVRKVQENEMRLNAVHLDSLAELQQVTLKVMGWEARDKRLVIKEAQMVGSLA